jgi:hypothetical protein
MKIVSDELKNTSGSSSFDIAIYSARSNPDAAEFTWSPTANNDGIFRGGLTLRMNSTSGTASGYWLLIDPVLNLGKLEEIRNGARGFPITTAPGQTAPDPASASGGHDERCGRPSLDPTRTARSTRGSPTRPPPGAGGLWASASAA